MLDSSWYAGLRRHESSNGRHVALKGRLDDLEIDKDCVCNVLVAIGVRLLQNAEVEHAHSNDCQS